MKPPTEAQVREIARLLSLREVSITNHPEIDAMPCDTLQQASLIIKTLRTIPEDPDPTMPDVVASSGKRGVNSYDGTCTGCNHPVPAKTGFYYQRNGKYYAHHKVGECSQQPAAQPAKFDPGLYVSDRYIVLMYQYNNRVYGKYWEDVRQEFVTLYKAHQHLAQHNGRPMTQDEIDTFSAIAGAAALRDTYCRFCGRALTDDRDGHSKKRGYGPVCANKYNLPWGLLIP
jgi:hypothetical protein